MYKNKRFIGILIVLITIMTWTFPTIKVLAEGTGEIKAVSRFEGVTYKLNPDVVKMPRGIDYEVLEEEVIDYETIEKPVTDQEKIEKSIKRKVSIPTKTDKGTVRKGLTLKKNLPTNISEEEPLWNREKDYTPKTITVDNQTIKKIDPKIGRVYFDPVNHTTIKVTGEAKTDASGAVTIPVEKPDISEVIEDIKIPEQTVSLTDDDISYIHPQVEIVETSSANITQVAAKDGFVPSDRKAWKTIKLDGLTLIDLGTDLTNKITDKEIKEANAGWRTEAEKKLDEEEKAKLEDERKEELEQSVKVEIKKGYIKIFNPEITASLEWEKGIFKADARADIDIESDILIEGKVQINREVEILLQGFELDFEVGKVACGIYLVVGIDGNISFEARVQQQGTASIGAAVRGLVIPMVVYPVGGYDNTALETEMILSGNLKYWALAMPRVSLQVLDHDILDARFRIGIEAGANFYISSEEPDTYRLWIDLLLQLRIEAILVGERSLIDERINLYDKTKVYDESQPAGGGTDGVSKDKGYVLLAIDIMDAARDVIRGSVTRAKSRTSEPETCQGEKIIIQVLHIDGTTSDHEIVLGENGEFYLNAPITPLDRVKISYDKMDMDFDYSTSTGFLNVRPPYTVSSIYRDGFNNKVFGEISGEVYGPNEIAMDGDEEKYPDNIYIRIAPNYDSTGTGRSVSLDENGKYSLENISLKSTDLISAGLVFEGGQVETQMSNPSLGLEIYTTIVESDDKQSFSIIGSIQNLNGDKLYKGPVKLKSTATDVIAETIAYELNEMPAEEIPAKDEKSNVTIANQINIKPKLPDESNYDYNLVKDISTQKSIKEKMKKILLDEETSEEFYPSTLFEFNIPIPLEKAILFGGAYVEIEHNGIRKTKRVIGGKPIQAPELENAIVSPIEEIINSRINPAMGKDMKRTISDITRKLQAPNTNTNTNANANIDISQMHGVSYSLVQTLIAQPGIYSFKDDSLKLKGQGGSNGISLSWDTTFDTTNIEGYRIYRGLSSGGEELVPISGTLAIKGNNYVDTKVSQGTTYYYLCSVVYKNGDEFIISNEVMLTK